MIDQWINDFISFLIYWGILIFFFIHSWCLMFILIYNYTFFYWLIWSSDYVLCIHLIFYKAQEALSECLEVIDIYRRSFRSIISSWMSWVRRGSVWGRKSKMLSAVLRSIWWHAKWMKELSKSLQRTEELLLSLGNKLISQSNFQIWIAIPLASISQIRVNYK